jgi:hypothetical protein
MLHNSTFCILLRYTFSIKSYFKYHFYFSCHPWRAVICKWQDVLSATKMSMSVMSVLWCRVDLQVHTDVSEERPSSGLTPTQTKGPLWTNDKKVLCGNTRLRVTPCAQFVSSTSFEQQINNEWMVRGIPLQDSGPGRASHRMWRPLWQKPAPWERGVNVLLDQSLPCQQHPACEWRNTSGRPSGVIHSNESINWLLSAKTWLGCRHTWDEPRGNLPD